jgi:two-component system response regulator RegA
MKEGADSFATKPCDVDTILNEANKILEKKRKRIPGMDDSEFRSFNLNILERVGIEKALKATKGNVSKAATLLGIDRRTLQRKMKRMF